jgi:predicted dehydrogenase
VAAVCDVNAAARDACTAACPEVKAYAKFADLLKDAAVDLVCISIPNELHAEFAIAALDAGKHLFLEKPMALNPADCRRILDAEERSGKRLGIDFELRYSYLTGQRVKGIIDSGEIGELRQLQLFHARGGWIAEGAGLWRIKRATCGGIILMDMCHMIDLFRYFAGEVEAVQAFAAPNIIPHYDFPDNSTLMLFFESGVLGILTETHAACPWQVADDRWEDVGHEDIFTVVGSQGCLRVDAWKHRITVSALRNYPAGSDATRLEFVRTEDYAGRSQGELSHDTPGFCLDFINRIARNEPPLMTAEDSWRTHRVCFAADLSVAEGSRRVTVAEV